MKEIKFDIIYYHCSLTRLYEQGDQLNMAVFFWYRVKSDVSERYNKVAYNGQATFYKVPEQHSHV